jgi:hypothetical protein
MKALGHTSLIGMHLHKLTFDLNANGVGLVFLGRGISGIDTPSDSTDYTEESLRSNMSGKIPLLTKTSRTVNNEKAY